MAVDVNLSNLEDDPTPLYVVALDQRDQLLAIRVADGQVIAARTVDLNGDSLEDASRAVTEVMNALRDKLTEGRVAVDYREGDVITLAEFNNGDEVVPEQRAKVWDVEVVNDTLLVQLLEYDGFEDDGIREVSINQIKKA